MTDSAADVWHPAAVSVTLDSAQPPLAPQPLVLLAADRWRVDVRVTRHVLADGARRGAVAVRTRGGAVRRAEPGPAGPLILEAWSQPDGVALEVWGPPRTEAGAVAAALEAAVGWASLRDDLDGFAEVTGPTPRSGGCCDRSARSGCRGCHGSARRSAGRC